MMFLLAESSFTGLQDQFQNALNSTYGNVAADINWLL